MSSARQHEDGEWPAGSSELEMRWTGRRGAAHADGHRGSELTLDADIQEGEHHDFVLVLDADDRRRSAGPDQAWRATTPALARRVPDFAATVAPRDARTPTRCSAG